MGQVDIASKEFVDDNSGWKYFGYKLTQFNNYGWSAQGVPFLASSLKVAGDYAPQLQVDIPEFNKLQVLLMPMCKSRNVSTIIYDGQARILAGPKVIFEQVGETNDNGTRLLECIITPEELRACSKSGGMLRPTIGFISYVMNRGFYDEINLDKAFIYFGYLAQDMAFGLFRWK